MEFFQLFNKNIHHDAELMHCFRKLKHIKIDKNQSICYPILKFFFFKTNIGSNHCP